MRKSLENNTKQIGIKQVYQTVLQRIEKLDLSHLPDSALIPMAYALKDALNKGRMTEEILVDAFSLVKEAACRVLKITPYPTQLLAGLALYEGRIAQMQTGEGKTLAAVMPAFLRALEGKGVHILTFNDYLSKRDALWMGPILNALGLKVGFIQEGMTPDERRAAYNCDITYVTAREAGFDYLRDFMCMDVKEVVLRPFYYAIVDEADSIMIDEARIPLIIAGKFQNDEKIMRQVSETASQLIRNIHYEVDEYGRNIFLTDAGIAYAEKLLGCANLYENRCAQELSALYAALYVNNLLKKDKDYIIKNGRVLLVDEFTGRIAEKRMFPSHIQSAIEAKEGITSEDKGTILGSITMQNFLSLYPRIAGMTGTAVSACSEFRSFYQKEILEIPTYKPCVRVDHPDRVFTCKGEKHAAIVKEIQRVHQTGQPILIGTQSVEDSEALAEKLYKRGLSCYVLNARNDEMEAAIIARAGEKGAITVSTNMAGRGVDIKLGGENETERAEVAKLGGLYVLGTSHHESVRIDNQLRGRAGRQGDPGESGFFISLEDSLFIRFGLTEGFLERYSEKGYKGELKDEYLKKEIARCQHMAEGYNGDMRAQLSRYAYVIEQQRRIIFKKRFDILYSNLSFNYLKQHDEEFYNKLCGSVGESGVQKAEKQLILFLISKSWMEYLEYIEYSKESIHLVIFGGKSPLDEFNRKAIAAFDEMQQNLGEELMRLFKEVTVTADGIDMKKEGLMGPASTWTYLMDESTDQFSKIPHMIKAVSKAFTGTLFTFKSVFNKLKAKTKK